MSTKTLLPFGVLSIIAGVVMGVAAFTSNSSLFLGAAGLIGAGVLQIWLYSFTKDIKSPGFRGGMRQMAAGTGQALNFMQTQSSQNTDRLRQVGRAATATVVGVNTTGMEINFTQMAGVDLLVTLDGHAPYPVTITMPVHNVASLGIVKGGALKVLVDPEDQMSVLIEGPAPVTSA